MHYVQHLSAGPFAKSDVTQPTARTGGARQLCDRAQATQTFASHKANCEPEKSRGFWTLTNSEPHSPGVCDAVFGTDVDL